MNEVLQAQLLAASLKLTKAEISKLRKELEELLAKPILVEGPIGEMGPAGLPGLTGEIGPQGLKGDSGSKGDTGPQGERGDDGISISNVLIENNELIVSLNNGVLFNLGSVQGPQGEIGPQGIQGETGPQGPIGEQGELGPIGPQGAQGEKGDTGLQGLKGDKGDKGDTGEPGIQGPPGEIGAVGPKGDRGERGSKGERGDVGPQGPVGPKGESGEVGPEGPQGPAGRDGGTPDVASIEKKLLKLFEELKTTVTAQVTRLNLGGGSSSGGGEVRLLRLDDVDTAGLANGRYLRYNSTTQKLEFVAVTPGGGASSFDELSGTISANQISNNSINVSKFINDVGYLTTSVSNAVNIGTGQGIFANTVNDTLQFKKLNAGSNITLSVNSTTITISSTASGGGGGPAAANNSLDLNFSNSTGTNYKIVALDSSANTILASSLDISQIKRIVGVLKPDGDTVGYGTVANPSWSWTPNQELFLGDAGNIVTTSTIDGAAFSLSVGVALSSTKIFVKLGIPVAL